MALSDSAILSVLVLTALCSVHVADSIHTMIGEEPDTLVDDEDSARGTAFFGVEFQSSRSCEEDWFTLNIATQIKIKEQIRWHVVQVIENLCDCEFTSTYISNDGVECDPLAPSMIQYTGIISSLNIDKYDSRDLIFFIQRWVMGEDVVNVSDLNLLLSPYNIITANDFTGSSSGDFTTNETPISTDCIPNVDGDLQLLCQRDTSSSAGLSLVVLLATAVAAIVFIFKN